MSIDTAAILAAKFRKDPTPLKAAVLGQGDSSINPYAALRALQLQQEAQRFQMAQAAMQGQQYQNQPSMVEQAVMPGQMQPPMPQQMPQQMPQEPAPEGLAGMPVPEQNFAPGGIVAFAGDDGSLVEDEYDGEIPFGAVEDMRPSPGSPASYEQFAAMLPGLMRDVQAQEFKPMSEEDFANILTSRRTLLEKGAGPSPFAGFQAQLEELQRGRQKNLKEASGLALLAGIEDVLKPGGLARGLGGAAGKFASVYGQALTADKAEQRALMSMNMNLATAKRSEDLGLNREALAAANQARQDYNAAQRFKIDKTKALANLAISGARATKPTGGADKGPKNFDALAQSYFDADLEANAALPKNKQLSEKAVRAKSYQRAASDWAKMPAGETAAIKREDIQTTRDKTASQERKDTAEKAQRDAKEVQDALEKFDKSGVNRRLQLEDSRAGTNKFAKKREAYEKELRNKFPDAPGGSSAPPPPPPAGNKNSSSAPAGGKVVTRADIKATATASGRTEAEVEAAAKAKGYTIK
jgi:hypothetical protein